MKNLILTLVIIFAACLMLSGCYTYLSLSDGAKHAEVEFEPYYPPDPGPPLPPPPPPPPLEPRPDPIIVVLPYNPPSPPYERPKNISDLRDGIEGRNPDNDRRR